MDEREERVQDEVETSWLISAATPLYDSSIDYHPLTRFLTLLSPPRRYGATDQTGLLPSANFDTHDDVARNQSFIYSRGKCMKEALSSH